KGVGKLGGDDLDAALAAYLADRLQQKTGYDILRSPYATPFLMAVERAKIALSGEKTAVVWAPGLVPERHLSIEEPLERAEIERGIDIPCSFSKRYYPVADPAERVTVSVYEGDVYDDPDDPENVKMAEIPWAFDPPRPQADAGIDVTFEYADDGILTVAIKDP